MTTTVDTSDQLDRIVSTLNHKMTGSLARLEGLYLLYQQEGKLRDELWQQAFEDAKDQLCNLLGQSFTLRAEQKNTSVSLATPPRAADDAAVTTALS